MQSRPDLQLKSESAKTQEELPSRTLIAVSKVTGSILENCSNKHLYSSCEVNRHVAAVDLCSDQTATSTGCLHLQHLTTLLAASDQGVVTATLQAFVALVRKTHIASIRYPGGPEQNARLLALAQGWGGKEQVSAVFNALELVYLPLLTLGVETALKHIYVVYRVLGLWNVHMRMSQL